MSTVILELELLDDVAITASNATIDAHESLTYIPGQCLLGAMARAGYHDHGLPDGEWTIFHSGRVRFGCALPLVDGEPAWPTPLAWHVPKGESATDPSDQVTGHVVNLSLEGARAPDTQYQQVRGGYVNAHGVLRKPGRSRTMRTAIGAEGRARDGFLFTMSALTRGQTFVAELSSDDASALAAVEKALVGAGTIRVGRSRSAEFGAAKVARSAREHVAPKTAPFRDASSVLVWCLSDVCLRDRETGQPTFTPTAAQFGLPKHWVFATSRSYLRTRRYSPFNAHRKRPDLDRQVIVEGSVLRFESPDGSTLPREAWDRAREQAARGVGEHLAEGLGRVAFEPELLRDAKPVFSSRAATARSVAAPLAAPADPLIGWIDRQHGERLARDQAWTNAMKLLRALGERPRWTLPASQWGEVRRLARVNRALGAIALGDALDGFVRATGPQRGVRALRDRWGVKQGGQTLAQWIVHEVKDIKAPEPVPGMTLEILSSHAVRQQRAARGGAR